MHLDNVLEVLPGGRDEYHAGTGALQREGTVKIHYPFTCRFLYGCTCFSDFFVGRWGPLCYEFCQSSALYGRSTFKPESKARQLQCPLDDPACCFWIVQYPLQRKASDHRYLMCLEVMAQLSRGHEEAEKQLLHPGVSRSSPLQEGTHEIHRALHHLLPHFALFLRIAVLVGARACRSSPLLVAGFACRWRRLLVGLPLRY